MQVKYNAQGPDGEFTFEATDGTRTGEDGTLSNFVPAESASMYGETYVALTNFRNRARGVTMTVPTTVTVLEKVEG